jgi:hypothetical protein
MRGVPTKDCAAAEMDSFSSRYLDKKHIVFRLNRSMVGNRRSNVNLAGLARFCRLDFGQCCPSVLVEKRGYRVCFNGADHQWGKDPPKEVVG